MSEWRPIEEAPKDGTPVLLYSKTDGINIARFKTSFRGYGEWVAYVDGGDVYDGPDYQINVTAPTHFMPLPPPPKVMP